MNPVQDTQRSPQSGVSIVSMVTEDIEDVSRLERRCYTLPWSANAYVTELGNSNAYYAVAKNHDSVLLGYGGIWVIMDEMHITTLAVDPAARGCKTGERLLIALMLEGINRGATRATLEVRQSNVVAQNLYHKYGYQDVAVRRAYYSDNQENAIIMWAEDLTSAAYQQKMAEYKEHLSR